MQENLEMQLLVLSYNKLDHWSIISITIYVAWV